MSVIIVLVLRVWIVPEQHIFSENTLLPNVLLKILKLTVIGLKDGTKLKILVLKSWHVSYRNVTWSNAYFGRGMPVLSKICLAIPVFIQTLCFPPALGHNGIWLDWSGWIRWKYSLIYFSPIWGIKGNVDSKWFLQYLI